MSLTANGRTGSIRVGGREAAALTEWTFRPDGAAWSVRATLAARNALWLDSSGPFELRLALSRSTWRWRDVAVSVSGDTVAVTGRGEPESL